MIALKLIAIFLSTLLLLQSYIIRVVTGSYLVPAALFSFVWFIFTITPLVVLINIPINPLAILYILVVIFAFSLSAIPFDWKFALKQNKEKMLTILPMLDSRLIVLCFYFSIGASFIFSSYSVISNGFEIESFRTDFIGTSALYAAKRGNEDVEYGILGTLSIFFTYFSAVLGGMINFFKKRGRVSLLYFLLAVAPSLFAMLTQSSKLIFFVAVIFYLSSSLLMRVYADKHFLFTFKDVSKVAGISLFLFPLLIIAFFSRQGFSSIDNYDDALKILIPTINSYLFGSLYAFSDFFSYYIGMESVSNYNIEYYNLGYYSFKSIFDTFGGSKVFPPGYYTDFYMYEDHLATNIYSVFRGLIQDFGTIGTIVFMYVFGLFFHFFFYTLLMVKRSWFASSIFIMFFSFLGLSFLFNIFTARYIFLITFSLYFLLMVNHYISSKSLSNQ
jgi:oligosaccharide repeat unit polymerase